MLAPCRRGVMQQKRQCSVRHDGPRGAAFRTLVRVATCQNARNPPLSLPEPSLFSVFLAGGRKVIINEINGL